MQDNRNVCTFAAELKIGVLKGIYDNIARCLLMAVCLCCPGTILATEESDTMAHKVEWGVEFTTEQQVTHNGKYNCANLLRLNAGVALLHSRMRLDVATLSAYMTNDESIGQDLQTFSNLDAGTVPLALSMAGLTWQVSDRHTLYLGVRNMNVDYFASPLTSLFTNSSCGIYPTLSANYPVANYPLASMGAHYRYHKVMTSDGGDDASCFTLQASLYDGTGHRHFTGRDNVFRFCPDGDGVFALADAQYQHHGSRYFVGNALYARRGVSVTPWAYVEQRLTPNLSLLAGYSHAFGSGIACSDFVGMGAHYQLSRAQLGLFTDYARFAEAREWATELTCNVALTPFLDVQPTAHMMLTSGKLGGAFTLRACLHY